MRWEDTDYSFDLRMNKFVLSLVVFTILIASAGNVLALDFDNVKEYDDFSKTVTITNSFGLGDTIAEIRLNTPLVNYVPHGEDQKVAEFELDTYDNEYINAFEKIDLYDKKDKENLNEYTKTFEREFTYKLLSSRENVYNKTTEIFELQEEWVDFNYNTLMKGKYTVGIFTDVYIGDVVEWIPTFYGIEIEEWAGWFSDADIITGLGDIGDESAPTVFYMAPHWYLISGNDSGTFNGFVWNETSWYANTTISTGLDVGGVTTYAKPTVFYMAPHWYTLVGKNTGQFSGFVWNETSWYANTTISTGLGEVGVYSSPTVFEIDSIWYLISGNQTGLFSGFVWNETSWYANTTISTGLGDIGDESNPNVFEMDSIWYLISGNLDGDFNGFQFQTFDFDIILLSPENNSNYLPSDTIDFSANILDRIPVGIANVSLVIDGILNQTNSSGIVGLYNFTFPPAIKGNYNWTIRAYTDSGLVQENSTRFFTLNYSTENSVTYNTTTYETAKENYILNLSSNGLETMTATFEYNGTVYGATKTGNDVEMLFTSTVPSFAVNDTGNKTFFWNVSYGGVYYPTATYFQYVNDLNFQQCNGTGYPFLNFTFKDEEDDTFIDARLSTTDLEYWLGDATQKKYLSYLNVSSYESYDFCLNVNRTLNIDGDFEYKNTSYPQKVYAASGTLTNDTSKVVLYLLNEDDGIYTTIQVVNEQGDVLPGVDVSVEKQIGGVWTLVSLDETDSAGSVTFWLNPDDLHIFTFNKSSCVGTTSTIRPTQVTYTQTMNCGTDTDVYISPLQGIIYSRTPAEGILPSGLLTNFTYQIVSSRNNIANASMRIIFANGTLINTTWDSCAPGGCTMFVTYTPSYGANIKGMYYVDIGNGSILLEGDSRWRTIDIDVGNSGGLLTAFMDFQRAINGWSASDDTSDYNRLVIAFFLLAIILCGLNYATGMDSLSPGLFLTIVTGFVFLGSIADGPFGQGFFYYNNLSGIDFVNNYILVFLLGTLTMAQWVSIWRRTQR